MTSISADEGHSTLVRLCLIAIMLCLTAWPAMAANDMTKCDARILREHMSCTVSNNGDVREDGDYRITVYNSDGKSHGTLFFFDSKFYKLKSFEGKVFDAQGRLVYTVGKNDGERICGFSGYALYADICIRMFTLSCGTFPYTIEYRYTMEHKTPMGWPVWAPMADIPVDESIYELQVPQSCQFEIKAVGEIGTAQILDDKDTRQYRWELRDVPAFPDEEYSFEQPTDRLSLRFAPHEFKLGKYKFDGSSWESLAAGSSALFRDQYELGKTQLVFADEVFAGEAAPSGKCTMLHDALIERSRYVAIEIGVGGWEPSPAAETFTRGYGDCKDLSTMYIAMLRHAGIPAKPALLITRDNGWTDPKFPQCYFNHVILFTLIDGDTVWTDPTCQSCAVGDLIWYDENISVLAADPENGGIVQTPSSTPEENAVIRSAELELTQGGSAAVYLTLTATGNSSHRLQRRLEGTEKREIDDLLKNDTYGIPERFTPDVMSVVSSELGRSRVVVRLSGVVRNAKQTVGQRHFVDLDILGLFTKAELADLADRKLGIELQYPRSYVDTLMVRIPPGWKPAEIPQDITLQDDFGSLHISIAITNDRAVIIREKKSYPYRIYPEQLEAFAAHIAAFKDAVPKYLVLEEP